MARTFTPKTSSFHYKMAGLVGSFAFDKPQTLCGYVLAVLHPVFLTIFMAVMLFVSCVFIGSGFLILSGLYTNDIATPFLGLIALGMTFVFLTLLMGTTYAEDTRVGRFCNTVITAWEETVRAVFRRFTAFTCTTSVTYPTDRHG